jgi:hypothetical protein
LKDIPGGDTGLLVKDYKGKDANQVVYKFDSALVNDLCKESIKERGLIEKIVF